MARPQKARPETRASEVCSVRALTISRQLSAEPCQPTALRSPGPARWAHTNALNPRHIPQRGCARSRARPVHAETSHCSVGILSGPQMRMDADAAELEAEAAMRSARREEAQLRKL